MSDRVEGTIRGRPRSLEAPARGSMLGPAVALVTGIVILALVLGGLGWGMAPNGPVAPSMTAEPASPDASIEPSTPPSMRPSVVTPTPVPATSTGPTLTVDVPGSDAADMPRFPGSVRVRYDEGEDGRIAWVLVGYRSSAPLEAVREHYRQVFRDHGWFVGDVSYADDAWTFDANQGTREVHLEIAAEDDGAEIDMYLSWTVDEPAATIEPTEAPTATPAATRRPGPTRTQRPNRTQRPQRPERTPRPQRPRPPRDDDDDDDDDGDDDDDDDD